MKTLWYYDFPVGKLAVASYGERITDISFGYVDGIEMPTSVTDECARRLYEYFEGKRRSLDIEPVMNGTPFQISVWNAVMRIPYGETRSYGDIAYAAGYPRAARAVGTAMNKNRTMILIPCHRVISADGSLGGYAGRQEIKQYLIDLEKNNI